MDDRTPPSMASLLKRLGELLGDLLGAMKMLKNLRAFTLYGNFPESEFESESKSESSESAPERLLKVLLQHSGNLNELIVP